MASLEFKAKRSGLKCIDIVYSWAAQTGVSRPKFFPGSERSPFPGRETQRPVFGRKLSFRGKNPVKAGNKKSRETGCFRAKTPKTDLWHHGLGHRRRQPRSHSPETGFSKRGFPHFPGIFQGAKISNNKNSEKIVWGTTSLSWTGENILQTVLSRTGKILVLFGTGKTLVCPVRERLRSFRYGRDSGLSPTGETLVSPVRERLRSLPYGRDPTVSRMGDIVQDIPMESGLVGFSLTRGESYSVC